MFSTLNNSFLVFATCLFLQSSFVYADFLADSFPQQIVKAAQERTQHKVIYNGAYVTIDYPMGDMPLTPRRMHGLSG